MDRVTHLIHQHHDDGQLGEHLERQGAPRDDGVLEAEREKQYEEDGNNWMTNAGHWRHLSTAKAPSNEVIRTDILLSHV